MLDRVGVKHNRIVKVCKHTVQTFDHLVNDHCEPRRRDGAPLRHPTRKVSWACKKP